MYKLDYCSYRDLYRNLRNSETRRIPKKFGSANNVYNGPRVFSEIRNNEVHPGEKKIGQSITPECIYECWDLGLWWLELSMLKIFNFQGKYYNRCNKSLELDNVPWIL